MKVSNGIRNILRSMGLFWLEGLNTVFCMEVRSEVFAAVDNEAIFFDVHRFCPKPSTYLGVWILDLTTQNISQIHPLLSIHLRAQAEAFGPFGKQISYPTPLSIQANVG